MKNKKRFAKLAALALAATMLAGSATVVSAHEVEDTVDANALRGALCPDCNYGEMRGYEGPWQHVNFGAQKCSHHLYGEDKVSIQKQIYGSKCNYCGVILKQGQRQRVVFVKCYGFD